MLSALDLPCTAPVPYVSGLSALRIETSVQAGFPSPAEDFCAERIDVLQHLILHPQATYALGVGGDSLSGIGIFHGDVILVDRAIRPRHGLVVVAVVDGSFTCKKLWQQGNQIKLQAANPAYSDIIPREGQTVEIWGVVLISIKRFLT